MVGFEGVRTNVSPEGKSVEFREMIFNADSLVERLLHILCFFSRLSENI